MFAAATTHGTEAIFAPSDEPRIELPTAAYGLASLRDSFSQPLFVLFAAVALVLLIACANIAGIMLARSAARRKEMAMRSALGATRVRIMRQLLTESLLLSIAGGAAGILLGYVGAELLARFLARNWYMPMQVDVHPDVRVLAFTVFAAFVVGLLFGVAPAFSSGKVDLVPALKEGSGRSVGATHGRRFTVGNALVVAQMALAVLVLAGAGVLVRTLVNLRAVNPGFDPQNLLVFGLDTTYADRASSDLRLFNGELKERLATLPGVNSVTFSEVPLLSGGGIQGDLYAENGTQSLFLVDYLPVAPGFFETMRIPLRTGRTLNAQDSQPTTAYQPVVINENLAHRLFGNQNPVGRHFRQGTPSSPISEVVGVVGDAKYDTLRANVMPTLYAPIGNDGATFEIRTAMDPKALMPEIRTAVSRFDSNLLITDMKTQMEQIDQNIYQERLIANLSSLFALLALIVACVGIYGLLSYQVTRRTQEIGIRLALGARREDVLRVVLWQGAALAILGALIGIAAALGLTRYLQSLLFGVKPTDPVTIISVAFGLIAVALLASYIPARRAMKTDPMVALRYE
jgi:predicted permease